MKFTLKQLKTLIKEEIQKSLAIDNSQEILNVFNNKIDAAEQYGAEDIKKVNETFYYIFEDSLNDVNILWDYLLENGWEPYKSNKKFKFPNDYSNLLSLCNVSKKDDGNLYELKLSLDLDYYFTHRKIILISNLSENGLIYNVIVNNHQYSSEEINKAINSTISKIIETLKKQDL